MHYQTFQTGGDVYGPHLTTVAVQPRASVGPGSWNDKGRPFAMMDTECDFLWWLVKFRLTDGRMFSFSICAEEPTPLAREHIQYFLENYTIGTFNGINYDIPMLALAMSGASVHALKRANDNIIKGGLKHWHFWDQYPHVMRLDRAPWFDHVDIMEVAPGVRLGLKTYMGRMHAPQLQDLPFDPEKPMPVHMRAVTDEYCGNDLFGTQMLFDECKDRLALRVELSKQYGVDLRSKSDAQMAEAIIKSQLPYKPQKRIVAHGHRFQYTPPEYIRYATPQMQQVLELVRNCWFVVNDVDQVKEATGLDEILEPDGKKMKTGVLLPPELKNLRVTIGGSTYQLGIGGLHSTESSVAHHTIDGVQTISDHDVKSYYPSLILLIGMYPEQLGPVFLEIYGGAYRTRLEAKAKAAALEASPDKAVHTYWATIADGLKIVLNGTFGKLFSKHSIMFAPELGIRVTLTGQLCLLMLIETLHLSGVSVVSANTDGIVVRTPAGREFVRDSAVRNWERVTGLEMEASFYKSLFSRDVNCYVAIKSDGKIKSKGAFAKSGVLNNVHPERDVCADAVIAYLSKGVPLRDTIRDCKDLRRFLVIRNVKGGGHDAQGNYLGKTVRWYYGTGHKPPLRYGEKLNKKYVPGGAEPQYKPGNMVAGSEGAQACMKLPPTLPPDIDYDHYEKYAVKMLASLGVAYRY